MNTLAQEKCHLTVLDLTVFAGVVMVILAVGSVSHLVGGGSSGQYWIPTSEPPAACAAPAWNQRCLAAGVEV